ncbi:MAG: HAD family hydrolase [Thermomicrobiales bacterium]
MGSASAANAMGEGRPRAVFFDLDDTLCDYSGARELRLRTAFGLAFQRDQQAAPEDVLDRMIVESIRIHPHAADHFGDLLTRYGVANEESADVAVTWYRQNRFHGLNLFPDALATIGQVRSILAEGNALARGRIGIVTNGPAEVQRAKLARLSIENHVDFAIVSGEVGAEKPLPEIFSEALRRAEVEPAHSLFVGDSLEFDIAGAARIGMPSVWVNRRGSTVPDNEIGPTHVISSLSELPSILLGLRG